MTDETEPTYLAAKGLEPRQGITHQMVECALRSWYEVPPGQLREFDSNDYVLMLGALSHDRLGPAVETFGFRGTDNPMTRMAEAFKAAEYARTRELNNAIAQYEQLEECE